MQNAIVTPTHSDTSLLLQTTLSTTISANFLDMVITTTPVDDQEPCLIYQSCAYCDATAAADDADSCDSSSAFMLANATLLQTVTRHKARLQYKCGLGREFKDLSSSTGTSPTTEMTCEWDPKWTPTDTLKEWKCERTLLAMRCR